VSASRDEILAMGRITAGTSTRRPSIAMALFAFGQRICAERGLILVDTKYELGGPPTAIMVIDEIHTPDSSRFWYESTYQRRFEAGEDPESFDKEYVRRWLAAEGFEGDGPVPTIPDDVRVEASRRYMAACEQIWGRPFEPDLSDPLPRIRSNLGLAG
jgi:phosphoribosylaminoimidazole-succinocarboxamide synthase